MTLPTGDEELPEDLKVLAEIGQGSCAVVYRARLGTGEYVALKRWRDELDDAGRRRFHHEIAALHLLDRHPNVVRIKAAGAPAGSRAWIVSELCEQSLDDLLARGPVDRERAFDIADDILCGLQAVHAAGHLHRDLKPQNVLLVGDRAKLCDMGLAAPTDMTVSNAAAGTGPYVAPELASGRPTPASDIYAAALTLQRLFGEPLPAGVEKVLVRASSARPADRPADVAGFRAALAAVRNPVAETVVAEPLPSTPVTEGAVPVRRRRLSRPALVAASVAGLLVAGATTAYGTGAVRFGWRSGDDAQVESLQRPAGAGGTGGLTPTPPWSPTALPSGPVPSGRPSPETLPSGGLPSGGLPSGSGSTGLDPAVPTGAPDDSPGRSPDVREKAPEDTGRNAPQGSDEDSGSRDENEPRRADPAPRTFSAADCHNASGSGGLTLTPRNSGGPNFVPDECRTIYLKLTAVTFVTYAQVCTESGSIRCGSWVRLEDKGAWNPLLSGVTPGQKYVLHMKADADERVEYQFSAK